MSQAAVLFGGPSPEHDVSVLTGLQAARALAQAGRPVGAIYWSKAGEWFSVDPDLEGSAFAAGPPQGAKPVRLVVGAGGGFLTRSGGIVGVKERRLDVDTVLNCCHGGPGEDGSLQALLDLTGLRYAGPSAAGAALGMDKLAFGAVAQAVGLPSLPRVLLTADTESLPWEGATIVKPRFGGSSIGIEVVAELADAKALAASSRHLRGGAVAEPYRPDTFDLNVSVRSWPQLQLSAIEKPLRRQQGEILGYADKYLGGEGMVSAPRELPAEIDGKLADRVREAALRLAQPSGLRGVARIDFLCDGDDIFVNEVNTVPGSLSSYLWKATGVPFATLLTDLLAEAAGGPARTFSTEGADGSVLRAAGSIASKLG